MIELDDVRAAARTIDGVAHRTPVVTSATLDDRLGARVYLKAESFQRVGAFKFRGAYNRIANTAPDARSRGVLAFSSGNHAQAVALAARLHGIPATILMPEDAPRVKVAATRGYGAEIRFFDRYAQDREVAGGEIAAEEGLTLVPPYDDDLVMAGQGTLALELVEDAGGLDVLVAPIGGGGLIAGCATAVKGIDPNIRAVGVEPAVRDITRRSLAAGHRVGGGVPRTIADGLQTQMPGERTFEVNRRRVDEVVVATDDEMVTAMRLLFERLKLVVEPSGACALAAVLAGRIDVSGRRVGIVLSGGNIDAERFAQLVTT